MASKWIHLLAWAVLGLATLSCPASAQAPSTPPPPTLPPVPVVPSQPIGQPENIPVIYSEGIDTPLLDATPPGWYLGFQVGVAKPSFNRLLATREGKRDTFLGQTDSLDLDWTV